MPFVAALGTEIRHIHPLFAQAIKQIPDAVFNTSNAQIEADFLLTPIELGMCSSLLLLDEK